MTMNKNKQMPNEAKKAMVEAAELQRRAASQKQAIFEESAFLKALWELNYYRKQLGLESDYIAGKIKEAVDGVLEELGPFNDEQKEKAYRRAGFTGEVSELTPEPAAPKIEIVK